LAQIRVTAPGRLDLGEAFQWIRPVSASANRCHIPRPRGEHHVYTTKIQKSTIKIPKPYKKKSKSLFLLPECSGLLVQVLLRTLITPNVHILSDMNVHILLYYLYPPPEKLFLSGQQNCWSSPGEPAKKNPKELPKKIQENYIKIQANYQNNPGISSKNRSKLPKQIQANDQKQSKHITKNPKTPYLQGLAGSLRRCSESSTHPTRARRGSWILT
jgi:hypothetical protein